MAKVEVHSSLINPCRTFQLIGFLISQAALLVFLSTAAGARIIAAQSALHLFY